jgi:hypothetical protein
MKQRNPTLKVNVFFMQHLSIHMRTQHYHELRDKDPGAIIFFYSQCKC